MGNEHFDKIVEEKCVQRTESSVASGVTGGPGVAQAPKMAEIGRNLLRQRGSRSLPDPSGHIPERESDAANPQKGPFRPKIVFVVIKAVRNGEKGRAKATAVMNKAKKNP
jgi:hypothetical protein